MLLRGATGAATIATALCASAPVNAQVGKAAVDSAAVARTLFRSASQAATRDGAIPLLRRAAHAWPTQPAYWVALARTAARVGTRTSDSADVRDALDALGTLGAGAEVLRDSVVEKFAAVSPLRDRWDALSIATASLRHGQVMATIQDSTLFAEGIDADRTTGMLYAASVKHRTIIEVGPDGHTRDLRIARHPRVGAILGVRVAGDGQTLYATTAGLPVMDGYTSADSAIAAVLRIRITDGTLVARWDLPPDGARNLLGDLTVGADGTVYITDSSSPRLFILRRGADTLETFRSPFFRSLQGVAEVPGRQQLVVADYSHGLLRVDLGTRTVARIADAPSSTSLGVDGIVWDNGSIVAVQNGMAPARVVSFSLNDSLTHILRVQVLDRQADVADEPTIATRWRGGIVYVANSHWEKYDDNGLRVAGTALRATQLMFVPLAVAAKRSAPPRH